MPRKSKVSTTYKRGTKTEMKKVIPTTVPRSQMAKPTDLSPLAQFVADNQDGRDPSTLELIRKFQEVHCEHRRYSIVAKAGNYSSNYQVDQCDVCGHVKYLGKKEEITV